MYMIINLSNLPCNSVLFRIFLLVDGVLKDQLMVKHQSFLGLLVNMF